MERPLPFYCAKNTIKLNNSSGDRVNNAAALAHIGIAQVYSKADLMDEKKLRAAIEEMLSNNQCDFEVINIRIYNLGQHNQKKLYFSVTRIVP